MTAAMELLHPAPFLLFLLFLLTRPGVTSADNNGPVKVEVKEGDDVVLPCSHGQTDLNYVVFDWKKDDQKDVFYYDSGIHSNNGRGGQDPQFKGRVSHFADELQHGNASIKIRNTQLEDSGNYSCIFPRLQNQIFRIELVVDPVLKKRNVPGASPEPYVTNLDQTADRALLQCAVQGASPKPTIEWKNSAEEVLTSTVTHESTTTSKNNKDIKLFDITLLTYVTQTGHYSCVVTQDKIHHQVFSTIFVHIGAVKVEVKEGDDVVLPCSLIQTDLNYVVFDWKKDDQKEVFYYDSGIHYNNGRGGQDPQFKGRVSHFADELQHGNASIKIRNTQLEDRGKYKCIFPRPLNQIFPIELVVGASPEPSVTILHQTKDQALLQCVVRGASPKPTVEWRNSSGNVVPAKEPQVTERGGSYDIILQTTVTKTDRYRCVSTQEEINHQVHADIHVYISAPDSGAVKVKEGDDVVLRCSLGQTNLTNQVFQWKRDDQEVFYYDSGKHYNNGRGGQDPQFKGRVSHFEDELKHGNASIKIRNTKWEDRGDYSCAFPRLQSQIFPIELVVDPDFEKRNGEAPEPPSGANTGLIAGWTVAAIVSVVLVAVV